MPGKRKGGRGRIKGGIDYYSQERGTEGGKTESKERKWPVSN